MREKDKLAAGKAFIYGSVVAVVLALIGTMGTDMYLASTQWMLVGIMLGVWGVYLLVEAQFKL